jgi:hypothetical protein
MFTINSNNVNNGGIIVGQTGIFELNLRDSLPINSVTFTNLNPLVANAPMGYLLVDIIYTKENAAGEVIQ